MTTAGAPEIFDIDDSTSDVAASERAKGICRTCPVRALCLAYALNNEPFVSMDTVTAKLSGRRRLVELEAVLAQLESMIAIGGAAQSVLMCAREEILREIAGIDTP
ncbi:MAG: WhiB family transcriptional regulator [Candidatus Nanopelagicales bacterium]